MDTMSVNGKDFTVMKLLGKGKGGYSSLVSDGEEKEPEVLKHRRILYRGLPSRGVLR